MTEVRENWRRAAIRGCEVFFLLILVEGVLRKWILNSFQQPLVLVRDPVLAMIYVQYCGYRGWRIPAWAWATLILLGIFVALIVVQSTYYNFGADVYLIGLRNYFMTFPIAFVMSEIYNRQELNRLIRLFLYTTIPIAILVVFQFYSPVNSLLNRALDDSIESVFLVADGVVRPYGPFTFTLGQSTFSALALAVGLAAWHRRGELSVSTPFLVACLVAIGCMGVVSGSRTYFLLAGAILICYMISAFTTNRRSSFLVRSIIAVMILTSLIILMTAVFPKTLETMSERQADAVAEEGSTIGRALYIGTEFLTVVGDTPVIGYGIGYGSNAGAYVATGQMSFTLAEYDWTRITLEAGPVLGVIVILLRAGVTVWAGARAMTTNARWGDPGPLVLFGVVGPNVLYAQIFNNNSLMSIGWFSLGVLLALSETAKTGAAALDARRRYEHGVTRGGRHGSQIEMGRL